MTPERLLRELFGRVLRVVNQQVDAVAQLHDAGVDVTGRRRRVADVGVGRLVVADVRDAAAVPVEAVAHGRPDVGHRADQHLRVADRHLVAGDVDESHVALQLAEVDREVRRLHQPAEHVGERAFDLMRAVDVEAVAGHVNLREERQALHVIPVDVGNESRCGERCDWEGLAEEAQTGSEIEENRGFSVHFDGHRGGVARRTARCRRWGTGSCRVRHGR